MVRRFAWCLQIAICGQLIVSCKSSCRTQNIHHSIGVRPPMCNWRYTVPRLENSSTGGGGGVGWCTTFKRVSCDNKLKTLRGLIKINGTLTLRWWTGGGVAPRAKPWLRRLLGPRLLIAVRIWMCVLFNTLIMVWVCRGSPNLYLQFYTSKSVVLNCLFKMRS